MYSEPVITFFYPKDTPPDNFVIDDNPGLFVEGRENHCLQSYLLLKKLGCPVNITKEVPKEGIVFCHADDAEKISYSSKRLLVVFLADRLRKKEKADLWIVQNPHQVDNRSFYLDHYPQPGLITRDSQRGVLVENVVYMGNKANLHEELCSEEWKRQLKNIGLNWYIEEKMWWDYSKMDVVVAVRRSLRKKWYRKIIPLKSFWDHYKPASKLINAWIAGVPAILSNDSAFRNLRKSKLDYLVAETLEEVIRNLKKLQIDRHLYKKLKMVKKELNSIPLR